MKLPNNQPVGYEPQFKAKILLKGSKKTTSELHNQIVNQSMMHSLSLYIDKELPGNPCIIGADARKIFAKDESAKKSVIDQIPKANAVNANKLLAKLNSGAFNLKQMADAIDKKHFDFKKCQILPKPQSLLTKIVAALVSRAN